MSWTQATLFAGKCQNQMNTKNENEMGNCIHGKDDARTQVLHTLSPSNQSPASECASLHVFAPCDTDIRTFNSCLKRLAAYTPRPQPPYPQSCSAAVLVAIFIGRWGDLYVILSRYTIPVNPLSSPNSLTGQTRRRFEYLRGGHGPSRRTSRP